MNDLANNKLTQSTNQKLLSRTPSTKLIQTLNIQRLQKYVLAVQNHLLKKQLELYEWRQKTDFPIVKIESFKIIDEKLQKTHLEVIINSCSRKINEIQQLKIQDVTLLIKQAFIGLERLYNKFRLFQLRPQMVIIDQKNKCRVWINSNFSLNQVQKEVKDFDTFYINIINIFEQVTIKNPTSMSFYLSLKTCKCFIKALKFIQDFTKTKKLKPNSTKFQMIKKIASTPNLNFHKLDRKLYPIEEESKNLRQTIGYLRKKQQADYNYKDTNQAMTFAGKNTRPLQKRLQQMIQEIPKDQIAQKNSLVLDKFRLKPHEEGEQNLKKVFKSIKDFKFKKTKHQHNERIENKDESNFPIQKAEQKHLISEKLRSQTTRNDFQLSSRKNYGFLQKSTSQTNKHIQQGPRFSVTETRSTSFFNNSGDKLCLQQSSTHSSKKFGNIKFSEISHKKSSEISDFNKEIETLLFGIQGTEKQGTTTTTIIKTNIFSSDNISSKSLHHNYDRPTNHNISILDNYQSPLAQSSKKSQFTKPHQKNNPPQPNNNSSPTDISASAKYGEIDQDVQQPTAQEISKKYIELGWKNTLNVLDFGDQVFGMKESIHSGDDRLFAFGNLLNVEKKPILLGKLDRIKNKQLVQSVMNQDFSHT